MNIIASREARQTFFQLIRQANAGEPTVVTIDGIPTAAVIGYDDFRKLRSSMEEHPYTDSADLERHALALAGGDASRAALMLSEALTRMLTRQHSRPVTEDADNANSSPTPL